jgi:hypothetical protein
LGLRGRSPGALLGTAGRQKAFAPIGGNEEQSDRVQAVERLLRTNDFNTLMQQAANDKNVRNVIKFTRRAIPIRPIVSR